MYRFPVLLALSTWSVAGEAVAEDGAPTHDDIMALAKDENIQLKMDKLVSAVNDSTFDGSYGQVYALVDMEMPEEVLKPAAAKAGMFWDGTAKALDRIVADGHASARPQTVTISGNADFVVLFEFFIRFLHAEGRPFRPLAPLTTTPPPEHRRQQ